MKSLIFSEGSPLGKLWRRFTRPLKVAYCQIPEAVLQDLAVYCFANAATSNEREQGRRDVWLRINQFVHMTDEDLTILAAKLGPEARHQLWHPSATYLEGND